ncbi:hypothetical protein [Burkholderia cepacia]|uniref:hypothetical protein n=1 Tax=Burkholderia cepacia TaxID=292 RepID=UPI00163B098B|nr:hypothetical protein [Burkholderia cepacia]
MTMVLSHWEGAKPVVHVLHVVDDFGNSWVLVPDVDFFGTFDMEPALAACAFERSGEVH